MSRLRSPRPRTEAEASGFLRTSRHADVMAFIDALRSPGDRRLKVETAGASPEGRDLPLLVLSSEGVSTPEAARALGRPVVLTVGGIHAGEVEGKEALLALVRDVLDGPAGGLLERMTWVVLPLFNPDGNDRIDPANRVLDIAHHEGQDGPASGVGTRVTSTGINLNRDYLRQDAHEMRLFAARVHGRWAPHLTVDTHATNGSVHRYALTYDSPHTVESGRREPIAYVRERFLPIVRERLRRRTGLETFWYGNFVEDEGGHGEGWMTYTHHPRFGSNYRGLTGRLDILAETYSYLPFEPRVRTSYEFVSEVLRLAAARGRADRRRRAQPGSARADRGPVRARGLRRAGRDPHLRAPRPGRQACHRADPAPRRLPGHGRRRSPLGVCGAGADRAQAGRARP